MKTIKFHIGNLYLTFVLKHYWEGIDKGIHIARYTSGFRQIWFGVWFSKNKAVGAGKRGKAMFDNDNMVTTRMIGLQLGWVKCWVTFSLGQVKLFEL